MRLLQHLRVDCGLGRHLLDTRSLRGEHLGVARDRVLRGLFQGAKLLQHRLLHAQRAGDVGGHLVRPQGGVFGAADTANQLFTVAGDNVTGQVRLPGNFKLREQVADALLGHVQHLLGVNARGLFIPFKAGLFGGGTHHVGELLKHRNFLVQIPHAFLQAFTQFHQFRLLHHQGVRGLFKFFADALNIAVDGGVLVEERLHLVFAAPQQAFCQATLAGGAVNCAVIQGVDLRAQFSQVFRGFRLRRLGGELKLLHVQQPLGDYVNTVERIGTVHRDRVLKGVKQRGRLQVGVIQRYCQLISAVTHRGCLGCAGLFFHQIQGALGAQSGRGLGNGWGCTELWFGGGNVRHWTPFL